jgi:hypothetical protein
MLKASRGRLGLAAVILAEEFYLARVGGPAIGPTEVHDKSNEASCAGTAVSRSGYGLYREGGLKEGGAKPSFRARRAIIFGVTPLHSNAPSQTAKKELRAEKHSVGKEVDG